MVVKFLSCCRRVFNCFKFYLLHVSFGFYMQNPIARWHICQGSINSVAFSSDGAYIATVGRDGIFFMRWLVELLILLLWLFTLLMNDMSIRHLSEYDWPNAGYLRIFDYKNEQLIYGGKSYYGALLCCAWRYEFMVFCSWHISNLKSFLPCSTNFVPPLSFPHSRRCPQTNEVCCF